MIGRSVYERSLVRLRWIGMCAGMNRLFKGMFFFIRPSGGAAEADRRNLPIHWRPMKFLRNHIETDSVADRDPANKRRRLEQQARDRSQLSIPSITNDLLLAVVDPAWNEARDMLSDFAQTHATPGPVLDDEPEFESESESESVQASAYDALSQEQPEADDILLNIFNNATAKRGGST